MAGPLAGIRILDLSRVAAGPYGTMILGDLGAEIIKVESSEGDISRVEAGPTHRGENFYYLAFNRNKKGIVLDLSTPTGKQAIADLVKVSDVVLNNFRPGAMERLGLGYEDVAKINPRIIHASVTGYGSTGPDKDRPAYDIAVLAASGILSVTGEPDGRPVRPGIPIADQAAAMFMTVGVLAALEERHRTGKGKKVEVALMDACVSLLCYPLEYYFVTGIVPRPLGNSGHLILLPYGVFKTRKGYVALGVCWPRITRAIGADWMADDPRFKTLEERHKHRDELNGLIEKYLAAADAEDWMEIFKVEDIVAAKVASLDEVAADPQVLHQKMVLTLDHPLGGQIRQAGNPIKMEGIDEAAYTAPPYLNQHEHEILSCLLGYSVEQIAKLHAEAQANAASRREHVRKVK